jgi:hypothetical protein
LIRPCKKTAVRDGAVQHSREIEIYASNCLLFFAVAG